MFQFNNSSNLRIDIDGNIDLRCILAALDGHDDYDDDDDGDDEEYDNDGNHDNKFLAHKLRNALRRWNKAQKIYQFPISPLSLPQSSSSSSSITLASSLRQQLRNIDNSLWVMPLESDQV